VERKDMSMETFKPFKNLCGYIWGFSGPNRAPIHSCDKPNGHKGRHKCDCGATRRNDK
jgi:hypothetical protein